MIQNLEKVFVKSAGLNVHVRPVFLNLIKIGYQLLLHHLNQGMPMLIFKNYNKIVEKYNDLIIMKFLDNKIAQVDFDNIHVWIIAWTSTNKS